MPSAVREWALKLALLGASSVVALFGAEVAVRIVHPISDGRDNVTMEGVPIKSWFAPGSVYRQLSNEYDARTTITDKGHRVPGAAGNPEVIFLGDSFTYGWGLADEETFAGIYCTTMHRSCANLGVPGTGTAKQLDRLERFLDTYHWRPREVKLFFFGMSGAWSGGNDFVDNFDERGLTEARTHGTHTVSSPVPESTTVAPRIGLAERFIELQSAMLQKSNLARLAKYYWGPTLKSLIVADPGAARMAVAVRYTEENLKRLDALSKRVGFEYSIHLIVPVQDVILGTYGHTQETLQRVAPKSVIPTAQLFADKPQDYYYAYDGHINARGSRRIGEFLVERERGGAGGQ